MLLKLTKKICRINEIRLSSRCTDIHDLIPRFVSEGVPKIETKEITISKTNNDALFDGHAYLVGLQKLPFKIYNEEAQRITQNIVDILRDPLLVTKYLQNLDDELGCEMKKIGIEFGAESQPQYLIAGKGCYVVGPPLTNYRELKKENTLDRILLKREMAHGINREGASPRFVEFVPIESANNFVADGHIFSEDEQVIDLIRHGKYSHRLQFEILRQAATDPSGLDLKISGAATLTQLQLLKLMAQVERVPLITKPDIKNNLWGDCVDSLDDSLLHETTKNKFSYPEYFNPDNYSFSSRSPFVFKSLITCFDNNNLGGYLRHSHWRQANKIIDRLLAKDTKGELQNFSFADIYTNCMKSLCANNASIEFIQENPLTLKENDDPNYELFNSQEWPVEIRKRKQPSSASVQLRNNQTPESHYNSMSKAR